jgi:hypothetical protein
MNHARKATLLGLAVTVLSLRLFAATPSVTPTPNSPTAQGQTASSASAKQPQQVPVGPGGPVPNPGSGQGAQTGAAPQADRPVVELYKWLELEAKKSTDSSDAVKTLALFLSGVTVLIAVGGFIQQWNEKRWKDQLMVEQAKLEKNLSDGAQRNRDSISEMKREMAAARTEMRADWSDFKREQNAAANAHRDEIAGIRRDARERENDIRTVVLQTTLAELSRVMDEQLARNDERARARLAAGMEKATTAAGGRYANLLYRFELVRSSLMAEIYGKAQSKAPGDVSGSLIQNLYRHQSTSLALSQLLSQEENVLLTGLGFFRNEEDAMPSSFYDLLTELDDMGRFASEKPKQSFRQLMEHRRKEDPSS